MSNSNYRLPLAQAADQARRIVADLAPVCERAEVAGEVRRGCELIETLDIVAIPQYAADLFNEGHGQNLLDMRLVHLMSIGKLRRASDTPIHELQIKPFYIGSLVEKGIYFKLEINVATPENWPVLLAIKTGPAEFSHRLVTNSDSPERGFLPRGWRIKDGWQVWNDKGERVRYGSEREFIEGFCGAWVEPEER